MVGDAEGSEAGRRARSPDRRLARVVSVLLVLLVALPSGLLTVTAVRNGSALGVAPSPGDPRAGTVTSAVEPGSSPAPVAGGTAAIVSPVPTSPGTVVSTVVLHNGSVRSGNLVPENGTSPVAVAVALNGSEVFVGSDGGIVAALNTTRHTLDGVVPTGGAVWGLAYDPSSGKIYGSSPSKDSVFVLDPTRMDITATIRVGDSPSDVGFDPANGEVYVANELSNNVSVIDPVTSRVVASIPAGANPDHVLIGGTNGYVFVSNFGSNNVTVIDGTTNRVVGSAFTGIDPGGMAYDPVNGRVYVTNGVTNDLTVLDSYGNNYATLTGIGACPYDAAFDPSNRMLFVSDTSCEFNHGSVSVVDPVSGAVVRRIGVGDYPLALVYVARTDEVYTANELSANVTVLNASAQRVVATLGDDAEPAAVAYDPSTGRVYVANQGTNNVSVLNGSTGSVLGSIAVGEGPDGLAYDPANHCLYVSNYVSGTVSVVDDRTDRVVANVAVGEGPVGLAYDSTIGYVYVANRLSNNVSAIYAGDNAVVGTLNSSVAPWAVTYDPVDKKVFVTDSDAYLAMRGFSDNLTVIDGVTNRVTSVVAVGTAPTGVAFDPGNNRVYVANGLSFNLSIVGGDSGLPSGSVGLNVSAFYSYLSGVRLDPLNGELWVTVASYFAIRNANELVVVDGGTNRELGHVVGGLVPVDIAFDGANGLGFAVNQVSGTVSVIQVATYPPNRFNVTFVASGLPPDWPWSATLGPSENASRTASVGFSMVDGTYGYTVGYVPGYVPANRSGSVVVGNASVVVTIPFRPFESAVRVSETGLPLGTPWWLQWDGITTTGTSSSLAISSPNGTYPLAVGSVEGYTPSIGAEWVVVRGDPISVSIRFTYAAPPGPGPSILYFNVTPGSVVLGENVSLGVTVSGGSAPLSYSYSGLPPGCASEDAPLVECRPTEPGNFSVTVVVRDELNRTSGASVGVTVGTPSSRSGTPPPAWELPGLWEGAGGLLVGAAAALGGLAGVLLAGERRAKAPRDRWRF